MMKTGTTAAALAALLALAAGCAPEPSYENADAFIAAFVEALARGDEAAYEQFYLHEEDFDKSQPNAVATIKNFMGRVRGKYLRACNGAASIIGGRPVEIEAIDYRSGVKRAAGFVRDLGEHYADVSVRLRTGEMPVTLLIEELFEVDGNWRVTLFATLVDAGTERLPDVDLQPSQEKRDENAPLEGMEEVDPDEVDRR